MWPDVKANKPDLKVVRAPEASNNSAQRDGKLPLWINTRPEPGQRRERYEAIEPKAIQGK